MPKKGMRGVAVVAGLICFSFVSAFSQKLQEADYIQLINQHFRGEREVGVNSGRVDIVTDSFAIEVEFAPKWKNAIGQSLWYGLQTNKRPGIVLVKKVGKELEHNKYVIMLHSALDYGGLHDIKVWVWPDDF